MPNMLPYFKKDITFNPRAVAKHNKQYSGDPNYFSPTGITVFFGAEGSGKTIALMHTFQKLRKHYPFAKTVANLKLNNLAPTALADHETKVFNDLDNYYAFRTKEQFIYSLQHIRNGTNGVIQIIDEYQNYFSNQDSKNVPPALIEQNAQNRKQRRIMLCTSQDFDQLAKPIRRRADLAVKCKTYSLPFIGDCLTVMWIFNAKRIDFDNNGKQTGDKPLKMAFFFHSPALRDSYDTSQIIFTGDSSPEIYQNSQQALAVVPASRPVKRKGVLSRRK